MSEKRLIKSDSGTSAHIIAAVFTIVMMAVLVCTKPALSRSGDMNIAEFLMTPGRVRSGFFFISPGLAQMLRLCNKVLRANWWTVFSLATEAVSLYTYLWFLNKSLKRSSPAAGIFFSAFFIMVFWGMTVSVDINFTETATLAAIAGFLLIFDACRNEKDRSRWFKIIAGIALELIAGEIRKKSLLLTLPFQLMVAGYWFVFPFTSRNLIESIKNSFRDRKKYFICAVICTGILIASNGIQRVCWLIDPEWKEYTQANALREDIGDYFNMYPPYSENKELYEERGLTETWINMVRNFITSDPNHFSSEELQKMAELRGESKQTFGIFLKYLSLNPVALCFLAIFLVFLFMHSGWKNGALPLFGFACSFALCSAYLIHLGRIQWHVIASYSMSGVISYIAMIGNEQSRAVRHLPRRCSMAVYSVLSAAVLLIFGWRINAVKPERSLPVPQITNENQAAALDFIDSDGSRPYFYGKEGPRYTVCHNLWCSSEPDYLHNYYPLSTNMILGMKDSLAQYGIDDVYQNLYQNPEVRIVYCEDMTKGFLAYMKEYYNDHIAVSGVNRAGSSWFIRYSAPVIPASYSEADIKASFKRSNSYKKDEQVEHSVSTKLSLGDDTGGQFKYCYVNVVAGEAEEVYSYGLNYEDNTVSGIILCLKGTWTPEQIARVELVGVSESGEVCALGDLTEQFMDAVR